MRGCLVDGLAGLGGIGEIDAAKMKLVRCCGNLRGGMIDSGYPRTLCKGCFDNHPAERA